MVAPRAKRLRKVTAAKIKQYGIKATLHSDSGSYSAATGTNTLTTTSDASFYLSPPSGGRRATNEAGSSTKRVTQSRLAVAGGTIVPDVGMRLKIGTQIWRIRDANAIPIHGDDVAYMLELVR